MQDSTETNGTKLDRAQVFALPEIVYSPSSLGSGSNASVNGGESPLMADESDAVSGMSPDSFRENNDRCISDSESNNGPEPGTPAVIEDSTPSQPVPPSPSRSEASDMYESSTCCPICIEEFERGETLRVLPRCKHLFHTECILPWLTRRQGCCPQCRTPVLPEEYQQRSRRSSPRRRGSFFSRESEQQSEEAGGAALTPTRLFSDVEDDLGNNSAAQENHLAVWVPYAVPEGNESHPTHAARESESSPELMEQGIANNEVPVVGDNDITRGDATVVAATVSADDIERGISAVSPGEDEEDRPHTNNTSTAGVSEINDTNSDSNVEDDFVDNNNIPDPPQTSSSNDEGFSAFLSFINTPSAAGQENDINANDREVTDKDD